MTISKGNWIKTVDRFYAAKKKRQYLNMGTVFVPQQPMPNKNTGWSPDLSSAAEYGKIEFIFGGGHKVFALPGPSLFQAKKALKGFNPDEDYILWPGMGDPAAIFCTLLAFITIGPASVTFLYWDRKRNDSGQRKGGFYVPLKFQIREEKYEH